MHAWKTLFKKKNFKLVLCNLIRRMSFFSLKVYLKRQIIDTPGGFPLEVFCARSTGRRPQGRSRTHWRNLKFSLAWKGLGTPPGTAESWWCEGFLGFPPGLVAPAIIDKQKTNRRMDKLLKCILTNVLIFLDILLSTKLPLDDKFFFFYYYLY